MVHLCAAVTLCVLLVASCFGIGFSNAAPIRLNTHAPIYIDGDSGFTSANGVVSGDGSSAKPYVISGWDIDASSAVGAGIYIVNTYSCFIVINVYVHNGMGEWTNSGIHLYNNEHALLVSNSKVETSYIGIVVSECPGARVQNNVAAWNSAIGIQAWSSDDLVISDNTASQNARFGIEVANSMDFLVTANTAFGNGEIGITAEESAVGVMSQNTVCQNPLNININRCSQVQVNGNGLPSTAVANPGEAVRVLMSDDFQVSNNIIRSWYSGICVWDSANGMITGNTVDCVSSYSSGPCIGMWSSDYITIRGNVIRNGLHGVWIAGGTDCVIDRNIVAANSYGISLHSSIDNTNEPTTGAEVTRNLVVFNEIWGINIMGRSENTLIDSNIITKNQRTGMRVESATGTLVQNNVVSSNGYSGLVLWSMSCTGTVIVSNEFNGNGDSGIACYQCHGTVVYRNNFIDNRWQVSPGDSYPIVLDDGYPSGGNYWSDYSGDDMLSGSGQDLPGSDGIGDTPYIVNPANVDRYPYMEAFDILPVKVINAVICLDMDALNTGSSGNWVTVYISLPAEYSVSKIRLESLLLNGFVPVSGPSEIKDVTKDKVPDLMVKFDRTSVSDHLGAEITITGFMEDGSILMGTLGLTVVPPA